MQYKAVFPISNENTEALPVKELGTAIAFYENVLGFTVIKRDAESATLKRDGVQIGLLLQKDHEPKQAGSCYFSVSDVESLHRELDGKGGDLGKISIQKNDGKDFRVFFLREFDNGYCFCFGQPA